MKTDEVRDFYNKTVKENYQNRYEEKRWFSDPEQKIFYKMTGLFISNFLKRSGIKFKNYLEVGPGPGTWTKIYLKNFPEANYNLVDISSEMLKMCKDNLSGQGNISYSENDFMNFTLDKKYDFIFSSRALEYFPDKDAFVKKIRVLLEIGGVALVITKTPKYFRSKILKKNIPDLHKNQIKPADFKKIVIKNGFKKVEIYPVVLYFPFITFLWQSSFFKLSKETVEPAYNESIRINSILFLASPCRYPFWFSAL